MVVVSSVPVRGRVVDSPGMQAGERPKGGGVATTLGKIGPGAKDAISALKAEPEDNLYKYWAEEAIKKLTAQ